ncbi:MAG: radical SAM family RiPP maturation amino acid epimerase, partial [Pseudomonadota bacterium]
AELLPLWRRDYLKYRRTEEGKRWPKAEAWDLYMQQMIRHRDLIREEGRTEGIHDVFDAWRKRQVNRSMSELGGSADAVVHPIVAFELSEGCTVGCWFCGLSAERYRGHIPYTDENAALWRGVVTVMNDLFGTAAQTGFCYWATDPCDNPDYDRFIEDYYHITGALPQTTTAAPLKDPALTRRILKLFDKYKTVTNRFSVLTVKHLNKIHDAFTPEELIGVELVMQNRESLGAKANAGRARERILKLREAGKSDKIANLEIDHTTIACVSGFLVSMPRRVVQLVSPVPGSAEYPLGYRVFGERSFDDAEGYRAAIDDLIATHTHPDVPRHWPARFREDLGFEPLERGFRLTSRCLEHVIENAVCGARVGELMHRGDRTIGEVIETIVDEGASVLTAAEFFDTLFASGLIDEPDENAPAAPMDDAQAADTTTAATAPA